MPVQVTAGPKRKVCFGLDPLLPGLGIETVTATLCSGNPRMDRESFHSDKHTPPDRLPQAASY